MFLVRETKFKFEIACDNCGRSLGKVDTLGEVPQKKNSAEDCDNKVNINKTVLSVSV